ncbi:MAG: hypothetical protein ISP90_00125 [Nevskia sp.]|nr:hypothetical protein [Nevskia sp.]
MDSVLALGFFIGLRHALEPDHVAAVATLAARGGGVLRTAALGIAWGTGHLLSLLLVGSAALLTGQRVPAAWSLALESVVGILLLVLGTGLLRELLPGCGARGMANIEGPGKPAARSTAGAVAGVPRLHGRAALVGIVHGLAGSAALVVLTASVIHSAGLGVLYLAVFGTGAIAGMASLSMLMALPSQYLTSRTARTMRFLSLVVGLLTTALGLRILLANAGQLL